MPLKIFISYRRQDSGANAIGIGQYLEKEFGRKNVYIDVEMQAGTKYPAVIEKRLAECRVLLVLIGPDWLESKDEHGRLRLQKSDDWVRLEIARALERNIAVIPVLINGAQLPDREMLPVDIQGLLDHQIATVSVAGFRHEMAGLASDIRSIKPRRSWRTFGGIAAGLSVFLIALVLTLSFGFHNLVERIRVSWYSPVPLAPSESELLKVRRGEWVFYAVDPGPNAYFFNPPSIRAFGDRVAYTARFALKSTSISSSEKNSVQGAYEDDTTVLDCKKLTFATAERTVYNTAGDILFHYKFGEPESLDPSQSQPINSGSILAMGQRAFCDEKLRARLLTKPHFDSKQQLSYLSNAPNGDGTIFYGAIIPTSESIYNFEAPFINRFVADQEIAGLFPGQNVHGLPSWTYRTFAENVRIACAERKLFAPVQEYYDKDENLIYLAVSTSDQPVEFKAGSIFDSLKYIACGAAAGTAGGIYEGMNSANYEKGGEGEQKIAFFVEQSGTDLKVRFESPMGGHGEGTGTLKDNRVDTISFRSTTPECPGSYDASLSFAGDSVSWSYTGRDCNGSTKGHGTATRVAR
jgi:hypothetical protein